MKVRDIASVIEAFAPLEVQESWDNSGLCIGSPDQAVKGVLVGFDCTPALIDEAVANGCDMVVTHHPLIFKGVRRIDSKDPVGSLPYKTCLSLLTTVGAANYLKLICSPDWTFLPDQWQVQQWGKLFARTTPDHLVFYAPDLDTGDFEGLPGHVLPKGLGYAAALQEALAYIAARENRPIETMTISYIADGPYAVPFDKEEKA